MKKILLIVAIIFSVGANAQAPAIQWAKCFGGSNGEFPSSVQQTTDGGYIVAGTTNSTDGDVTGSHGVLDYWIVKLNSIGVLQWQKTLGGGGDDLAYSIEQTSDSGYIVAGYTNSTNGDVTGNHGGLDYWIVKLNSIGVLQWQKTLGGSGDDRATSIQQTIDGGYILAGNTDSNDGDVTGNHGTGDFWVVKLNGSGAIQWQKCLGGSFEEQAYSIQQTTDGGYIVSGLTGSNDGDVIGNHGSSDYWVVKLSNVGAIQWQKCLGGSGGDNDARIHQTTDGGYIVAGTTTSSDGDITGFNGLVDYWITKLDSLGVLQWQKTLGGSYLEWNYSIQQTTDGGYIVSGRSDSNDGDVTGNHGLTDIWVVKLDGVGNIKWQKCLGGTSSEDALSIQQTNDGGYIVAGSSASNDGDVSGHHGGGDYWVVKLGPDPLPLKLLSFTAQKENNNVLLNWQTANEVNVSHINIQRSTKGNEFTTIGNVNASCCTYSYTDNSLLSTVNGGLSTIYYRLEIVDKDGSKTYSEVKNVELGIRNLGVSIYPNPVLLSSRINIECKDAKELLIIDYLGKEVYRSKVDSRPLTVNTKQFSKGIYIVKAVMNNGAIKTEKLVVE